MMNRFYYIVCGLLVFILLSCENKDEIEVVVPVSNISLLAPLDGAAFDLNDGKVSEYTFSWEQGDGSEELTLVLSKDELLREPVYIKVGNANSYTMGLNQIDELFANFGIAGGGEKNIYWSVKPSAQLGIASKEIRHFNAVRVRTKLQEPADMSKIQLNWPETETRLKFVWDKEGIEPDAEIELCFSTKADFSSSVASAIPDTEGYLTHQQLQQVLTELGAKKFDFTRLFWNVKVKSESDYVSRASAAIDLGSMMMFEDVRGDERIQYKVTRITYANGSSQVWLAENLRAKNYPDGTPIENTNVFQASETAVITAGHVKAYGCYYTYWIQDNIAPEGWRLPTFDEWQMLFDDSRNIGGSMAVLKDPVYYEKFDGKDTPLANAWGLGLVSAGNYNVETGELSNAMNVYCYYYAAGLMEEADPHHNFVHDGGWTLWKTWGTPCPARFVYMEK
ncbi:FISUMP domain-containing protein [Bacteroides congonensis]|uniref:FISUMP domain-containing protein n=1 Tax=Bacteroides congonensis TaxID=1871006 RepID=UPI001896C8C8|nr:FISUMP domain-containing protein [Bacteroides congonensis]